ncbi:cytosolic nonspecific dipeptidase [Fistulifera solaris]|uniref:Cytosolic nonspecific dipeptidase n=1 Tax=Fistulifera solaris TaxID=1519565 RepID=A0A1Z5JGV1_FISSO|nr:cytosolic nonspecific dipeptidase [Fistulifera solaris]|eukprot:GAX13230.1 cytosolic nonspecific dipeptidase [Fistulifera solaris]
MKERFFAYVDERQRRYIDQLGEAVAIPSVSSQLDTHLPDIQKMMEYAANFIQRLGGQWELRDNPDGTSERPLPPLLLGHFPVDPRKKTVCVYGHLDVQPAHIDDGWDSEPFVLTERDGKLFGRGSTDDKGPALSWLWVIEAHKELGIDLPVNIKILYEGMEEYGSEGLFTFIRDEHDKFLGDVDFFCISDNYWIGKSKPCLTYGLRGLAYFELIVQGCEQDLHSGNMGGAVHEAMTDLIRLMGTLVDSQGRILIEGVMDDVKPVTPEEEAFYDPIEFDVESFKEEAKVKSISNKLLHGNKKDLLMARWRFPTLSLHGIEGAFSGSGAKTVIPAKVKGKFSMRLVPDQDPVRIEQVVRAHIAREFEKLNSPNKVELNMLHGAKSWLSSPDHPNYAAAAAAIQTVFQTTPDYTREGGSIPITTAFEEATGMNALLLPIGACDDMAHSQNEKYNITNLMNGIKVLGMYLHELGKIGGPKPSSCRCIPLTEEELMVPGAFMKGFRCKCEM